MGAGELEGQRTWLAFRNLNGDSAAFWKHLFGDRCAKRATARGDSLEGSMKDGAVTPKSCWSSWLWEVWEHRGLQSHMVARGLDFGVFL